MSADYKLALVGAGVIGRHHGRVISQLADRVDLVAVADPQDDRAAQLTAEHGGLPYGSLTDALAAEDAAPLDTEEPGSGAGVER